MNLPKALKLLRELHSINQVSLGDTLDLSPSYISDLEAGKRTPSLEVLESYSDFFSVPLSSIFALAETIHKPCIELHKFKLSHKIYDAVALLTIKNKVKK